MGECYGGRHHRPPVLPDGLLRAPLRSFPPWRDLALFELGHWPIALWMGLGRTHDKQLFAGKREAADGRRIAGICDWQAG